MFGFRPSLTLWAFITFRVLSVFVVNTFFVPDEYWQSLEVAHKVVYGYGYLTWEWREAIRSYFYPAWIAAVYSVLNVFESDTVYMLTILPRILQAALYGVGDYCMYKLIASLFGHQESLWTAFCLVSAWFPFYCASRTLTNTAEAALSACVFYLYPWKKRSCRRRTWKYLWVMSVACLVRPTSAVIWIPLCAWHLWRSWGETSLKQTLRMFTVGLIYCVIQCLVDYCGYGYWVFTPLKFLKFNWFQDISAFYGTHSPYWYVTVGLPAVLTVNLVTFLSGLKLPHLRMFVLVVIWQVLVLSFLGHKEFRFLLPIVPMSLGISGVAIATTIRGIKNVQTKLLVQSLLVIVTLIVNVPLMIYMGIYHQRGTLDVMRYIEQESRTKDAVSVMFLMPCHSTPFYSFIHRNIAMDFLTCEPNLANIPDYKDEADIFYEDPESWLASALNKTHHALPRFTHIIMFDKLHPVLSNLLKEWNYRLCFETFHTDFPAEQRIGHNVQAYCLAT